MYIREFPLDAHSSVNLPFTRGDHRDLPFTRLEDYYYGLRAPTFIVVLNAELKR
jgi:hypothetical protein